MVDSPKISEPQFLSMGGEMGKLIRSKDWSHTSLGAVDSWPQSLRTIVSVCLNSRFPILIWWGQDMAMIYNDAYRPMLGQSKHPMALGARGQDVWSEIWHIIGPMLEGVLHEGKSTWSENQLLLLRRYGYPEECYFTFSYSPVYDESGSVGGIFCAVTETTEEVISARHLNTLKELSTALNRNTSEAETYSRVAAVIAKNDKDFPFALLYKYDDRGSLVPYEGSVSVFPAKAKTPFETVHASIFGDDGVLTRPTIKKDIFSGLDVPSGGWLEPPVSALIVPIAVEGAGQPYGLLVVGLNPHRQFTAQYQGFFELFAGQIAGEIQRVRNYEEEKKRTRALEEIDKAKTAFFSNISHEFRTPLTLILGTLETILNSNEKEYPDFKSALEPLHRNALRLLRLVNTLLDFSRIESGRFNARFCPLDVSSLTQEIGSVFRSLIEKAGLTYVLDCPPLSKPVYIDRTMWEKILFNLLSNAFKYTFSGRIVVKLSEHDDKVHISISDSGVGIPEGELPRMFERFHRARNSGGRSYEGTGIGLSLVKELVQLHGGEITVKSEEGKGTEFNIIIPFGRDHLPEDQVFEDERDDLPPNLSDLYVSDLPSPSRAEFSTIHAAGTRGRILIVDDNDDMRSYVETLLKKEFVTVTAENGKIAHDLILAESFDLVISDIMMPLMNGVELLHAIRANAATSQVPVIFLSARAGEEAVIEGYETGADDYLIKPFSARELIARVHAQLRIMQLRKHAEGLLENLFYQAPVAICILRGDNLIIQFANPMVLKYWSRESAQVMNKPILEALPEIESQGIVELLNGVMQSGESYRDEEREVLLEKNGRVETTYVSFAYEPMREPDGTISGVMVLANEVTELVLARKAAQRTSEALESQVRDRTAELTKKNEELEQFAYISSHDLQEPLRKIRTFSELIARNIDRTPLVDRYLDKIDSAASRMSSLIRSVLQYSRLSKTAADRCPVDLNDVLATVLDDFEIMIQEKEAIIVADDLPKIHAAPLQMHQLFANLVSNSLKFNVNKPRVEISADYIDAAGKAERGLAPDREYVRIIVCDNGIGFEEKYKERIFNMFQRLNTRDLYDGTGIGLALCKRIVENHGGKIVVWSQPGFGSRFEIFLPV